MSNCDYCKICNAPLNEDGTTEFCAGECDRQVLPDYSPMRDLNFDDNNTRRGINDVLPDDNPYSYENLIDQAMLELDDYPNNEEDDPWYDKEDWLPEDEEQHYD